MANILVAEDDESMRGYITHILTAAGYQVTAVSDGDKALQVIKSRDDFDLLITDIVMPEMDGMELSRRARVLYPDLKILYISGFIGSSLGGDGASPALKIMTKPFNLKDLVKQVHEILKK